MTSLILALGLAATPAHAGIRVIFRPKAPKYHECRHHDIHVHKHHRKPPAARPGGVWVWVPKHKVKHNKHYHWVPAHWEFRETKRR